MESTDNVRVKQVFEFLRGNKYVRNQQDFTERVGSDKSTMSLVLNGKKPAPNNMFASILHAFPMINPEWLRTGEGTMLRGEVPAVASATPKDYRLINIINIDAAVGVHSDSAITFSEQYTIGRIPFTNAREGDVAILQSGNSMSPTIPPGSVLLIREVVDWREYLDSGVYVIWLKDDRRITKEIRRYAPNPQNYILCVSYNPDVADEPLPRSLIRGVWKVVKYIADFGW